MRNKICATVIALGLLGFLYVSFAEDKETKRGVWKGQEMEYVVGEILVKLKPDVSPEAIQALLDKYEATVKEEIAHSRVKVLQVADTPDFLDKISEIEGESIVEYAEPNIVRYITSVRAGSWGYVKRLFVN